MSFYQPNRFNHSRELTEDQLRTYAPSIFAAEAHESRSDRFVAIPTIDMVRALSKEGWQPVSANQSRTRDYTRRNFIKHMVRFRHAGGDHRALGVGDNLLELVLVNGNDGSSAYKLDAGVFRIACLNGMVVKTRDYGNAAIRHTGDAKDKVVEASYEILANADRALEAPEKWSRIKLDRHQEHGFAMDALLMRYGADEQTGRPLTPLTVEQVLQPRRIQDAGNDLWRTFNRVQENLTQGGLHYRSVAANGSRRRMTTRQIRGIDQNVSVNKELWGLAETLALAA